MGYVSPAGVVVTSTYWEHRNRNPPSAEPGTDYATAYGSRFRMAGDGVVSVVDPSNGGGEGRRLSVDLDDGRRVSYIHLATLSAYVGQRVYRGEDAPATTGASGNGSDWWYGPHVHVTLHERPGLPYWDSIDFEAYIDPPEPPDDEEEDDMANGGYYARGDISPSVYWIDQATGFRRPVGSGELTSAQAFNQATGGKYGAGYVAMMAQAEFDAIPVADPASAGSLTTPAYAIGVILGLIGLVEVVRFVLDFLV
jgi:murein DD-endopeptidase